MNKNSDGQLLQYSLVISLLGIIFQTLVIKRDDTVIAEINRPEKNNGKGIVEHSFANCGDYTAYCIFNDGSLSQACEFSVCDLDFTVSKELLKLGEPLEVKFSSDNMNIIMLYVQSSENGCNVHNLFINDDDRRAGKVIIPGDLIQDKGNLKLWLIGENRYGRLKKRLDVVVKD